MCIPVFIQFTCQTNNVWLQKNMHKHVLLFLQQKDRASYFFHYFLFQSQLIKFPFSVLFWLNFLLVRLVLALVQWTQHCHPVRIPGVVSVAIQEPDHWCPVSAAGLKSSLPPWIFHLWILQNQCSVFAFQDRDHGSAFSFTLPYLFVFLRVCTCVSYFFNLSPHCVPLRNHNSFCLCLILLLFL